MQAENQRTESFGALFASPLGRRLLSIACTLTVIGLIMWNFPVHRIRDPYRDAAGPLYQLGHVDQDWDLFSFDPQTSIFLHLEVVRPGVEPERIDFPSGDPFLGQYRSYRWSAYEEQLLEEPELWDAAMRWAADRSQGSNPIERVDLVLLESNVSSGTHGPFEPVYRREVLASFVP